LDNHLKAALKDFGRSGQNSPDVMILPNNNANKPWQLQSLLLPCFVRVSYVTPFNKLVDEPAESLRGSTGFGQTYRRSLAFSDGA
jgi:hypothetical protein